PDRGQRLPRPREAAAPTDVLRPAGTDRAAAERAAHRSGARHRLTAAEGAPGRHPARRRGAVDRGGRGDPRQLTGHRARADQQGAREIEEMAGMRGPLPLSDADFTAVRAAVLARISRRTPYASYLALAASVVVAVVAAVVVRQPI